MWHDLEKALRSSIFSYEIEITRDIDRTCTYMLDWDMSPWRSCSCIWHVAPACTHARWSALVVPMTPTSGRMTQRRCHQGGAAAAVRLPSWRCSGSGRPSRTCVARGTVALVGSSCIRWSSRRGELRQREAAPRSTVRPCICARQSSVAWYRAMPLRACRSCMLRHECACCSNTSALSARVCWFRHRLESDSDWGRLSRESPLATFAIAASKLASQQRCYSCWNRSSCLGLPRPRMIPPPSCRFSIRYPTSWRGH